MDQFRHRGIVDAWWAAIKDLHFTGATHGAGDAICQLANATQQLLTLFCSEGTHGTLHLHGFGNDVKGGTGLNGANGDDGRTKRRGFTADERLQRGDDVRGDDNRIN